jgi:hypothetical protein
MGQHGTSHNWLGVCQNQNGIALPRPQVFAQRAPVLLYAYQKRPPVAWERLIHAHYGRLLQKIGIGIGMAKLDWTRMETVSEFPHFSRPANSPKPVRRVRGAP